MQGKVIEKTFPLVKNLRHFHNDRHLIFCGGEGMKTAVLALMNSGYKEAVTLVSHRSWITSIHPDWHYTRWGQGPSYLAPALFDIFKIKYPDHPLNEPMTFEQIKSIYLSLEEVIHQHPAISLIPEKISAIRQKAGKVKILDNGGRPIRSLHHDRFYLFNSAKAPRVHEDQQLPLKPFSAVYFYGKREISEKRHVVMMGSGLNTNWALRDLKIPIIYLIPAHEKPRAEIINHENCLCAIDMKDPYFQINTYSEFLYEVIGKDLKTQKILTFYVDSDGFYASMGSEYNKKIIQVDPHKVCHIDTSAKAENLRTYINSRGTRQIKAHDMRGTNYPNGNATHVHFCTVGGLNKHKYMHYPLENPQSAVHNFENWKETVIEKCKKFNIKLHPEFFESLYYQLKQGNTDGILTDKDILNIIKRTYKKTHPISANKFCFSFNIEGEYPSWSQFNNLIANNYCDQYDTLYLPKR